jgi:hypothetical protein
MIEGTAMLDKATLLFVADNMMARAQAERIMRDNARREGKLEIATMHADRAQAFTEAASAIPALSDPGATQTLRARRS